MRHVSYGCFSLVDAHGTPAANVIVAPGYVLLQRGRDAAIHDLSYLTVWSNERTTAVDRELAALANAPSTGVDATCPELRALFRAIAPASTPIVLRLGRCTRAFARRRLKSAFRVPGAVPQHA